MPLRYLTSKGGANVKPTFCHQTPPTPEVGEACGLHRTNHGSREATRTSCETKKSRTLENKLSSTRRNGWSECTLWKLRWEPRGPGPPDCAAKFRNTDNRHHLRQPGAGTADSLGSVCGCSEGRSRIRS